MRHVTYDTSHVTHQMRHMAHDRWEVVNLPPNFSFLALKFGSDGALKIWRKGSLNE